MAESGHDRERRLARQFAQDNRREFGRLPSVTDTRSEWLRERRDTTDGHGKVPLAADGFPKGFVGAEQALGLKAPRRPVFNREAYEVVQAIYRRLSPRDGKALVLYFERELSYRDMAEELGVYPNAAVKAVQRALKHARAIAHELGFDQAIVRGKVVDLPDDWRDPEGEAEWADMLDPEVDPKYLLPKVADKVHGPLRGSDSITKSVKEKGGGRKSYTCALTEAEWEDQQSARPAVKTGQAAYDRAVAYARSQGAWNFNREEA